jgi:hypothetical protein
VPGWRADRQVAGLVMPAAPTLAVCTDAAEFLEHCCDITRPTR